MVYSINLYTRSCICDSVCVSWLGLMQDSASIWSWWGIHGREGKQERGGGWRERETGRGDGEIINMSLYCIQTLPICQSYTH